MWSKTGFHGQVSLSRAVMRESATASPRFALRGKIPLKRDVTYKCSPDRELWSII